MQLNIEQRKIIQSKPNGNALVKGVAGSGKTTVAVNRIPFLLNNYCFEEDDSILMVTYNKLLVNYIRHTFNKIEEEEKNQSQHNETFYRKDAKESLKIETVDGLMYKYFSMHNRKSKKKLNIIRDYAKYPIMAKSIAEVSKLHKDIKLLDPKYTKFLLDEIDWIKSCNYMELVEYQNIDRVGRVSGNGDGPQRIMKNSKTRAAIYNLMLRYNENLLKEGYIDFKDMALIAYNYAKDNIKEKYTHIIIDESQDLTRVQLEFIKLLYKDKEHSSIMFVCDTAQSIYSHSWLVKGRSFTSIGFDMTGKSSSLTKNYRTTTQIAEAAYSLIEKDENIIDNENYVRPSLIDRQGIYPIYKYFNSEKAEMDFIINELKTFGIKECDKKDIAIISKKNNKLNFIYDELRNANIKSSIIKGEPNFDEDSIKLLTMHSIKGLEFKLVFIVGLNEDTIPFLNYQDLNDESLQESMDRKLLYVGMTRATKMLYLTSSSAPSKFIADINPNYLRMDRLAKARRFTNINIENYLFQDQIVDIYSNEEKVRQWFINELINTYKYPESLITIEHEISRYSKLGYVDICVSIYKHGRLIPYIFIETKAYANDIEQGKKQLESYLASSLTARYGVIVNGNDIKIINKSRVEIDDIPCFNPNMLPSSIEYYSYTDLVKDYKREIQRDVNTPNNIITVEDDKKLNYTKEGLIDIPIFADVAAGQAIDMNEEITGRFSLPKDWFSTSDYYMLTVKGDSMIEAGIDDGDYVLIKKQDSAQNRDIVVVAIGDDATLKRFVKMGDTILLMPENRGYEPIHVTNEQFRILGVARGIIKNIEKSMVKL